MSITTNNALQIREPLEIFCGMTAQLSTSINFTVTGNVKAMDSNINESLSNTGWALRNIADFADDGIQLDGTTELYDPDVPASLEAGKIGIRSNTNAGTVTITGTASRELPAVTLEFASGVGTVTCGAFSTDIRPSVVVPVNSTAFTITISHTSTERLVVASVVAGVVVSFTSSDIVRVNLDLRSDLEIINPSFEISSIEIQAYYPDDISEAITNLGDNMPIWYYSGIDGDYSPVRNFYLSEAVTEEDNIITIRGEDASTLLDDSDVTIQRLSATYATSFREVYKWFVGRITDAGVVLRNKEANPGTFSGAVSSEADSIIFLDGSARDHVANIMAMARCPDYGFYPVYVDAGIPSVRWSQPEPKWDIYEAECGDVQRKVDRNIAKVKTRSDYGVLSFVVRETDEWSIIEENINVRANKRVTKNFSEWYWKYRVAHKKNNDFVWALLDSVQWISDATTKVTLYGMSIEAQTEAKSVLPSRWGIPKRSGYTADYDPVVLGALYYGYGSDTFPNVRYIFERSNKGGSFTWKGDPRMQPRDVFNFHRLDGSVEVCTIETIELTHEGGGMSADISYRVGVV